MKTLGYYNGKFGPLEEMTVPMNDRACYFGDGVYEATLARNGKIFALKDHLDRFFNSAGLIKIDIPYTKDELAAILYDMLAKMDDKDIFIYWQMTRGTGIRQHQFPEKGTKPNLWIFMKPGKPADSGKRLKLTDMEDTRSSTLQYQDSEPSCQRHGCRESGVPRMRRMCLPPRRYRH